MDRAELLKRRIRLLPIAFTIGIAISGITAFPLRWEMNGLARFMGAVPSDTMDTTTGLLQWVVRVRNGLNDAYGKYPFIAYRTDWQACIAVIRLAFICGQIREIPIYHRLTDCSFGVFGIIPLRLCRRDILELARLDAKGAS